MFTGEKAAAIRVILIIVTVAAGGFLALLLYRLRFVGNCDNFCNFMFYPKKVKEWGSVFLF